MIEDEEKSKCSLCRWERCWTLSSCFFFRSITDEENDMHVKLRCLCDSVVLCSDTFRLRMYCSYKHAHIQGLTESNECHQNFLKVFKFITPICFQFEREDSCTRMLLIVSPGYICTTLEFKRTAILITCGHPEVLALTSPQARLHHQCS